MRPGVWVDMGFYDLVDGFTEHDGKRNVFKFLLKPNYDDFKARASNYRVTVIRECRHFKMWVLACAHANHPCAHFSHFPTEIRYEAL